MTSNEKAFFSLVRTGMWQKDDSLEVTDWDEIFQLSSQQTLTGILADAITFLAKSGKNVGVPEDVRRQLVLSTIAIEQRNLKMNKFMFEVINEFKSEGIDTVVLKGQGLAQNYPNPLHRIAGDIDFLFHQSDYNKSVGLLRPKAKRVEEGNEKNQHTALFFGDIEVECHGMINGIEKLITDYFSSHTDNIFRNKSFEYVEIGGESLPVLPHSFNAIFIFWHFLRHFYFGGLGLRQLCDWVLFLDKYSDRISESELQSDLKHMGLLKEWKVFAAFAVHYLGLPKEKCPLYEASMSRKSEKLWFFMRRTGNFGHNIKRESYMHKAYLVRKSLSLYYKGKDLLKHLSLFPRNTLRFAFAFLRLGFGAVAEGR